MVKKEDMHKLKDRADRVPLHRTTPFSLKDLARAAVYKWCNYYSGAFYKIDPLHIPEELKLYLRAFGYIQNVLDGI